MRKNSLLVNDHDHARLAVLARGTVEPHGVRIGDHDGPGGDHAGGGAGGDGHEAREGARLVGVLGDGRAGGVKGGLGDAVVARAELELHHVARGHLDVVGREDERVVVGRRHGHDVDRLRRGEGAQQGGQS